MAEYDYKEYARQMRENAVKDINGIILCSPELWEQIASIIENIPTAGVGEVKHGKWFIVEYESFHCSVCGKDVPSGADSTKQANEFLRKGLIDPYCRHCGARMIDI